MGPNLPAQAHWPKGRKRLTVLLAAQQMSLFAKPSATGQGELNGSQSPPDFPRAVCELRQERISDLAPSGRGFSFADLEFETTAWLTMQS